MQLRLPPSGSTAPSRRKMRVTAACQGPPAQHSQATISQLPTALEMSPESIAFFEYYTYVWAEDAP